MNSKRIISLKNELIKTIPKSPNTKETKLSLEQKSISHIIIIYLNWLSRLISIRNRKVIIEPDVTSDERWKKCKDGINHLLTKVRKGEDLIPHLSTKIASKGFVYQENHDYNRWNDKDFILNVMGFHHFHLGTKLNDNGFVDRSDEVLFAQVSRDTFRAIAIFNHSVFEDDNGEGISEEKSRLWAIYDKTTFGGLPPGSVAVGNLITCSGHSLHIIGLMQQYIHILNEIDPKLDDRNYVRSLFANAELALGKKNVKWMINVDGIGLYNNETNSFLILWEGLN